MARQELSIQKTPTVFIPAHRRDYKLSDMLAEDYRQNGADFIYGHLGFYLEQTGFYRSAHVLGEILRFMDGKEAAG